MKHTNKILLCLLLAALSSFGLSARETMNSRVRSVPADISADIVFVIIVSNPFCIYWTFRVLR